MTPQLAERAAGYGVHGDLALYATRLQLIEAWRGHVAAVAAPLSDAVVAFGVLAGGSAADVSRRVQLGSHYAVLSLASVGPKGALVLRMIVVDGTVPPPLPVPTIAMQLHTPERLEAAFGAVAAIVEWVRLNLDGPT